MEVQKVILPLSESRKGIWILARQVFCILRRQIRGLGFPEIKSTLFKQAKWRRESEAGELLKRCIFVCKMISDHNLNFEWAVVKTEKGTKQMGTEE